ncbi:ABC transporter ATP-binding protein [bacterium]|nr:MAG: ABC transporter ATP-binding protein [bacterium]
MGQGQHLLELKGVSKVFRIGGGLGVFRPKTITAVNGISFAIAGDKPSIIALVGESGSGKSTIANMILGLVEPTSGKLLYRERDVGVLLKENRREYIREVQAVFQDPYEIYNPFYKVEHILYMVINKLKLASSREEADSMIIDAMRAIGLRPEDLLGRYPHQLSGGERQRLMLARILLVKPKLLIADEPVSMIDASLRAIFLDDLMQLRDKLNMSCLYITHDLNIAFYVADRMIVLCYGKIVETGPAKDMIEMASHPYAQLLVSSIPIPNPDKRWKDKLNVKVETIKDIRAERGCIYRLRCPHAMPICNEKEPPMFNVSQEHEAACFLYD